MVRSFPGILLTGGALAAAILLLTLLPLSTAATTQPQFRPMDLPTLQCPPNTAQEFEQDVDDVIAPIDRFLDRTTAASSYSGTLMVPAVFAGRQAWLILRITDVNPDTTNGNSGELHELFLKNERGETIFLGVLNENLITPPQDVVFQIPQDFLTAGENDIVLQLDEGTPNQDPNVNDLTTGDITIDSMRVCYGGYFVYQVPLVCGFTPVDLNATGAPTYRAPAIKQGDYATNILIRNPDLQPLRTMTSEFLLNLEFVTRTSIDLPTTTSSGVNLTIPFLTAFISGQDFIRISCDSLMDTVRTSTVFTDPRDLLFWKGALIISQPIGNGTTQTKIPLEVQAVYTYELTVNKIRYQILRDPSGTIPRHLIGQDLEITIALSPANKTNFASNPSEGFQIMRAIRENIRTQYPAAANSATIRVIEVNVGVGSSQTVTRMEPTETPLEPPRPPAG